MKAHVMLHQAGMKAHLTGLHVSQALTQMDETPAWAAQAC